MPSHCCLLPLSSGEELESDLQTTTATPTSQEDRHAPVILDSSERWSNAPTEGHFPQCLQSTFYVSAPVQDQGDNLSNPQPHNLDLKQSLQVRHGHGTHLLQM
jgi:hypothetical protein